MTDADSTNTVLDYSYDGVGNRTSKANNTTLDTYSYRPGTQRLDSISGNINIENAVP